MFQSEATQCALRIPVHKSWSCDSGGLMLCCEDTKNVFL